MIPCIYYSTLIIGPSDRTFRFPDSAGDGATAIIVKGIRGANGAFSRLVSGFLTSSEAGCLGLFTFIAAFYFIPQKATVIYRFCLASQCLF